MFEAKKKKKIWIEQLSIDNITSITVNIDYMPMCGT